MTSAEANEDTLHLVAAYSRIGEIEVSGDADALLTLSSVLSLPKQFSKDYFLTVPPDSSASPYDGFLRMVHIENHGDKVIISNDDSVLRISGSAENVEFLAENIRRLANGDLAQQSTSHHQHIHIEYHPGHFFLAPSSNALIVVLSIGTS